MLHPSTNTWTLTDEAKDVPDGGDKDDQGVGAGQQDYGDDGVADPAELLRGAQELVDGGADLRRERERDRRRRSNDWTLATAAMSDGRQPPHDTYREQHHGDGEGDGGQHSQTDDQQDDIGLVDLGVGVQQLGLHMDCVTKKKKRKKKGDSLDLMHSQLQRNA